MAFVLGIALLRGEFAQALILALILGVHGAVYYAAPRWSMSAWWLWGVTLVDVVLAALAFYVAGNTGGQGIILGLGVTAVVAVRLRLGLALAVNTGVWFLFTAPLLYFLVIWP